MPSWRTSTPTRPACGSCAVGPGSRPPSRVSPTTNQKRRDHTGLVLQPFLTLHRALSIFLKTTTLGFGWMVVLLLGQKMVKANQDLCSPEHQVSQIATIL